MPSISTLGHVLKIEETDIYLTVWTVLNAALTDESRQYLA